MKNRGRRIVLAIIIVNLFMSVLSIIYLNVSSVAGGLLHQVIHLVLSIVFFYFLYRGVSWVRLAAIILFILSGVSGIIGGIIMFFYLADTAFIVISLAMYVMHIVSGAVLLFSPSIKAYFQKADELKG